MTLSGSSRRETTLPLMLLLMPFAFGAGLLAAAGWFGSALFGTDLDSLTRVLAAVCVASIAAMALVAMGYTAGAVLSAGLGVLGVLGAVLMVGGGGDDVSTSLVPAILALLSLSLIAFAIRWITARPIQSRDTAQEASGVPVDPPH